MADAHTAWVEEHFIGGHPALDLANAVYDRKTPVPDNELLKSARDVGNWLHAVGLADRCQAEAVAGIAAPAFVERVHELREASYRLFGPIAEERPPAAEALGLLFSCAASGLAAGELGVSDARPELGAAQWQDPDAVTAFLAGLSIEGFYTLPRDRLRACPRCGWLFVDTSRGGKRRWCNMKVCGNREKVTRHREHAG